MICAFFITEFLDSGWEFHLLLDRKLDWPKPIPDLHSPKIPINIFGKRVEQGRDLLVPNDFSLMFVEMLFYYLVDIWLFYECSGEDDLKCDYELNNKHPKYVISLHAFVVIWEESV